MQSDSSEEEIRPSPKRIKPKKSPAQKPKEKVRLKWWPHDLPVQRVKNNKSSSQRYEGGRRSPAVACWASDHWVDGSNPLRGKFRH